MATLQVQDVGSPVSFDLAKYAVESSYVGGIAPRVEESEDDANNVATVVASAARLEVNPIDTRPLSGVGVGDRPRCPVYSGGLSVCSSGGAGSNHSVLLGETRPVGAATFHATVESNVDEGSAESASEVRCRKTSHGSNPDLVTCLKPSNTPTSFPTVPTILAERYLLLKPVDSSTCQAIDLTNHQTLHIKCVPPSTALEVASQQALLGDAPGVRSPLEVVTSRGGEEAWLVFPPHYGDLHCYVRLRRRLREAEAQRLFAQIAATVERCHAAGLVLRDLKLRKFVFTDPDRREVALESVEDSVFAREQDLLYDKHGCPAYVAPEILTTSAYSGRHADMWGLGVILYTMLVGRYPFHYPDTTTLFAKIRSGVFMVPEWVSSRARHLITSLLRRHPSRRLTARQVLTHPWLTRPPRDHSPRDHLDYVVPSVTALSKGQMNQRGSARCPRGYPV